MQEPREPPWLQELRDKLPRPLLRLLDKRDSAWLLAQELPKVIKPSEVARDTDTRRAWELTGVFFRSQARFHDAIRIFTALYDHILRAQEESNSWAEKGMPLVWISQCYADLGYPALAKRFLMLTLCEDAIRESGNVAPDTTGSYFRLVWERGLPDFELNRYAREIYQMSRANPVESLFPEWILQRLDQNWMTEFPSPQEANTYSANTHYVRHLLGQLGDRTGVQLETLAEYVLSCMPGCRTTRRQRSGSTDYDIVCSIEGLDVDFRSELGRYFVCECKDWQTPADFTTFAKLCRVLDSIKARFGILFSKHGISGSGKTTDAEREQIKVFQDRGMVIVVIDHSDLQKVAEGGHFINLLRNKYERVRLDIVGGG